MPCCVRVEGHKSHLAVTENKDCQVYNAYLLIPFDTSKWYSPPLGRLSRPDRCRRICGNVMKKGGKNECFTTGSFKHFYYDTSFLSYLSVILVRESMKISLKWTLWQKNISLNASTFLFLCDRLAQMIWKNYFYLLIQGYFAHFWTQRNQHSRHSPEHLTTLANGCGRYNKMFSLEAGRRESKSISGLLFTLCPLFICQNTNDTTRWDGYNLFLPQFNVIWMLFTFKDNLEVPL